MPPARRADQRPDRVRPRAAVSMRVTIRCQNSPWKTERSKSAASARWKPGGSRVPVMRAPRPSWRTRSRRDDPRQVRVDAEQHRDAVEVEQERERRSPSSVCRPRNGEKPKNTPSANAAAVRSGVSSMCSSASSQRRTSPRVSESSEVTVTRAAAACLEPRRALQRRQSAVARCRRRCASAARRLARAAASRPRSRGRTVNSSS